MDDILEVVRRAQERAASFRCFSNNTTPTHTHIPPLIFQIRAPIRRKKELAGPVNIATAISGLRPAACLGLAWLGGHKLDESPLQQEALNEDVIWDYGAPAYKK